MQHSFTFYTYLRIAYTRLSYYAAIFGIKYEIEKLLQVGKFPPKTTAPLRPSRQLAFYNMYRKVT